MYAYFENMAKTWPKMMVGEVGVNTKPCKWDTYKALLWCHQESNRGHKDFQ